MPGKAQPSSKKRRIQQEAKDLLYARAVARYQYEQERALGPQESRKGLRKICKEVEIEHRKETGQDITLNHNTLLSLSKGGRRMTDFNAAKGWLTENEEIMVVDYVVEVAKRGFPLTHRRLKEHVDEICRSRLGDRFPVGGIGQNWTQRFMERHHSRLSIYRARNLESKRGNAVNETTNTTWFQLLGEVMETGDCGLPISQECTWGTDETGFQPSGGPNEIVIGARGQKSQYQQRDGNRETITVIVTICGDGTTVPPAVIYKGQAFQAKWRQDNPADALLGYSKKGWTNGVIGVAWIEQFDKQTREKANGRWRLLLVDGHNSHYTRGFLSYARQHRIHVLCYPSHTTHVYQGLDVSVFSVLKRYWGQERDAYERDTGELISKENFLTVYGRAHIRALKPELIQLAFRKTGVFPFNPNIVNKDMMAPSREREWRRDTVMPLPPPSPVRIVANLLSNLTVKGNDAPTFLTTISEEDEDSDGNGVTAVIPFPHPPETPVRHAVRDLATSNIRFLVSNSPLSSKSVLPAANVTEISPAKQRYSSVLSEPPSTVLEEELQDALRSAEMREASWKKRYVEMQSHCVLQELYVKRVRRQLAQKETRKVKGKNYRLKNTRARLLTSNEFFEEVVLHEEEMERVETEKEAKKAEKQTRAGQFAKEMILWEMSETDRKRRNEILLKDWKDDVVCWEAERDLARQERRRPQWKKPLKPKMEKGQPKPKARGTRAAMMPENDSGGEEEMISVQRVMDEGTWETESEDSEESEDEEN